MLVVGGIGAFLLSVPVAIAIAVLLAVVSISYRQVCYAYPERRRCLRGGPGEPGAAVRPRSRPPRCSSTT